MSKTRLGGINLIYGIVMFLTLNTKHFKVLI